MAYDLSVIIPARNEEFLARTIEDVLENMRADTEVIAICDGYWPRPAISDHPRVTLVHHTESIGQRAAVNEGARISQAKYIMKLDAHCAVSPGFDVALMEDCQADWTMVPAMHNLHIFDWRCKACGHRTYQGLELSKCEKCSGTKHEKAIVWKPRAGRRSVSWLFDKTLHFQYWKAHGKRPDNQGDLLETMSFIGACMFLQRDRFWALGGMDEAHGSWGQFGTEWACKSWLSGGKLVTSRKAWFAHLFRTGNFSREGASAFPYHISGREQQQARKYSQSMWLRDRWPKAIHPLAWLVERFQPVPGWEPAETE